MQGNLVLWIRKARDLDKPVIHHYLGITLCAYSSTELCTANGDRGGGAVNSVGVRFPAKMINLYAHLPQQNVKQLAKRMSSAKILEHYAGAWPYHHEAAVRELDRYPTSG